MASSDVSKVAWANNHLAINLHKLLAREQGNVFFSPFGVSTALAMLYCGAENETSQEMRLVLGYDDAAIDDKGLAACFSQFLSSLKADPDHYTLDYANSLLTQLNFLVKGEYKSVLETFFHALTMEVDFQKESAKVVGQINDWVSKKTRGMISQLLDRLDPSIVLVLLNAVYFKGSWVNKFPERLTYKNDFYNKGSKANAKQIDMMHIKESFYFVEKQSFKALELPYRGEEISMLVLLPPSLDGLSDVEALLSPEFLRDLKKEMWKTKVKVAFPKFRLEYSKSLKAPLQTLGMNRAFSQGAHLSGISENSQLAVSDVFHKAVLVVNEEGSEAAAATVIAVAYCAMVEEPEFYADHPFVFVIYNTKSGAILFMGRVEEL